MNLVLMICAATNLVVDEQRLTSHQFAALLKAAYAPFEDIEMLFEGTSLRVDNTEDGFNRKFQGVFAWRSQGEAVYLDLYRRPNAPTSPFMRITAALLRSEIRRKERWPDQGIINPPTDVIRGGSRTLNDIETPLRFLLMPILSSVDSFESVGFVHHGWEQVDGWKCAKIDIDEVQGVSGANRPFMRMWIDVDRGMHPRRIQFWRENQLVAETNSVRIEQLELADGRRIWFPVYAESYNGNPAVSKTVSRTICYVVKDTLRINQALPDSRFDVEWKARSRQYAALRKTAQDFEETLQREEPVARATGDRDPRGVRELLEFRLLEADKQARQLESSSPDRETISGVHWLVAGFTLIGVVALGYGIYRNVRR